MCAKLKLWKISATIVAPNNADKYRLLEWNNLEKIIGVWSRYTHSRMQEVTRSPYQSVPTELKTLRHHTASNLKRIPKAAAAVANANRMAID